VLGDKRCITEDLGEEDADYASVPEPRDFEARGAKRQRLRGDDVISERALAYVGMVGPAPGSDPHSELG
jgi:hypothetical protein